MAPPYIWKRKNALHHFSCNGIRHCWLSGKASNKALDIHDNRPHACLRTGTIDDFFSSFIEQLSGFKAIGLLILGPDCFGQNSLLTGSSVRENFDREKTLQKLLRNDRRIINGNEDEGEFRCAVSPRNSSAKVAFSKRSTRVDPHFAESWSIFRYASSNSSIYSSKEVVRLWMQASIMQPKALLSKCDGVPTMASGQTIEAIAMLTQGRFSTMAKSSIREDFPVPGGPIKANGRGPVSLLRFTSITFSKVCSIAYSRPGCLLLK